MNLRSHPLIVSALLGLLLPMPVALAQSPTPHASEADSSVFQEEPALASLGNGRLLLAWAQSNGWRSEIRVKRLEHGVNTSAKAGDHGQAFARSNRPGWQAGDQLSPAFGPGFLVWSEVRPGEEDYDLFAQRHGVSGRAMGQPVRLLARAGHQTHPAVAADASGAMLLVWEEVGETSRLDIWGLRLSGALVAQGAPILLAGGPDNASEPAIAADPGDGEGYLLVWSDDRNWMPDLFGMRLTRGGLPERRGIGAEFAIQSGTDAALSPSLVTSPGPASRDEEAGLLAWHHVPSEDEFGGGEVMAVRLRRNGLPQGEPFPMAPDSVGDRQPALAPSPSGGWSAVWVRGTHEVITGIYQWLRQAKISDPPVRPTNTPVPSPTPPATSPPGPEPGLWGVTIGGNGVVGRTAHPVVIR